MQLKFNAPYLSITEFDSIDLPSFAVITGVNGAGKSHLLRAIAEGNVVVGGIAKEDVVLFSNDNFRLDNQSPLTADQAIQERHTAWDFLHQRQGQNIIGHLEAFKRNLSDSAERIRELAQQKGIPIWNLGERDGLSSEDVLRLDRYKQDIHNYLVHHPQLKNNHQAQSLFTLSKRTTDFVDLINKDVFHLLYEPRHFRENFLPIQLTLAFADYYSKLEGNQYRKFRNSDFGEHHSVMTDDEFIQMHGPKPWDVINQVLTQMGTIPYRINSPEGLDRFERFQAELIHQSDPSIRPNFTDLSSGEKVLLALVVSVYKASSDRRFPKLLLLDEIDASLHPSMMQSMLNIIHDVFLENDVNTILVSHSPTTIALSPECSIHVMHQSGARRIEQRGRREALEILTEGFVTLDQGLTILDQVARANVSIITEGKNVDLIRKALELEGVAGVEVISGVEDRTGSGQLRTLYDFFLKLPHSNKVVVAWDCDADKYRYLASDNETYPFVFERNLDNAVATKGIENLFSASLLDGFKKEIYFADGRVKIEFDENQKVAFARHILDREDPSDFVLFKPFVEFVRRLAAQVSENIVTPADA